MGQPQIELYTACRKVMKSITLLSDIKNSQVHKNQEQLLIKAGPENKIISSNEPFA